MRYPGRKHGRGLAPVHKGLTLTGTTALPPLAADPPVAFSPPLDGPSHEYRVDLVFSLVWRSPWHACSRSATEVAD